MSLKSLAARIFAKNIARKTAKWAGEPLKSQEKVFKHLIRNAQNTKFGIDHNFKQIKSHSEFVNEVPIRDYEALREYVEKAVAGKEKCSLARKTNLFCKNLRNHLRSQIYSHYF